MIRLEFKSDYDHFTANNFDEPEFLKFYDSDGKLAESLYTEEVFSRDYYELVLSSKGEGCIFVALQLKEIFEKDGISIEGVFPYADFRELYVKYGRKCVNRIGHCALVIKG